MKLSIKTTVQPPSQLPYKEWLAYIKHPVLFANSPKEGGVGYEEQQEQLLKDAKKLLSKTSYDERVKNDRVAYLVMFILVIIIALFV